MAKLTECCSSGKHVDVARHAYESTISSVSWHWNWAPWTHQILNHTTKFSCYSGNLCVVFNLEIFVTFEPHERIECRCFLFVRLVLVFFRKFPIDFSIFRINYAWYTVNWDSRLFMYSPTLSEATAMFAHKLAINCLDEIKSIKGGKALILPVLLYLWRLLAVDSSFACKKRIY